MIIRAAAVLAREPSTFTETHESEHEPKYKQCGRKCKHVSRSGFIERRGKLYPVYKAVVNTGDRSSTITKLKQEGNS